MVLDLTNQSHVRCLNILFSLIAFLVVTASIAHYMHHRAPPLPDNIVDDAHLTPDLDNPAVRQMQLRLSARDDASIHDRSASLCKSFRWPQISDELHLTALVPRVDIPQTQHVIVYGCTDGADAIDFRANDVCRHSSFFGAHAPCRHVLFVWDRGARSFRLPPRLGAPPQVNGYASPRLSDTTDEDYTKMNMQTLYTPAKSPY